MGGRKVFQPATVLTAADVNNFLMDQSVMVFANSAARASAIGTPTAGMVSYLEDTLALQVYGTAWAGVSNPGDITAVTAGSGLTGGGVSGDVTLNVNFAQVIPTNTVTAAGDLIVANGSATVTRLPIGSANSIPYSTGTALAYSNAGTATQVLSIGTAGVPIWTTPAGGGDKVFTSLYNAPLATGSTNVTISGLASYDTYAIWIDNVSTNSTSASLNVWPNSSTSGNSLAYLAFSIDGSSRTNAFAEVDSGSIYIGQYTQNAGFALAGFILIQGCKGSSPATVQFHGGANTSSQPFSRMNVGGGMIAKSASVSSFTFSCSSPIDNGSVRIWGA